MIERRRCLGWFRGVTLVPLTLALLGCSEELGPERMAVTRVEGFVKNRRSPVSGGWIEFIPAEGTVGVLCSAKIHADGSFDAARVPVGVNLIRLAHAPLGSRAAERLFGSYHSPIRRTISAGNKARIVIDIFDEAVLSNLLFWGSNAIMAISPCFIWVRARRKKWF